MTGGGTKPLSRTAEIEGWVGLIGAFGFLAGAATFCYQLYLWLKTGEWVQIPLSFLFAWLGIDLSIVTNILWLGVQKIPVWVLNLPLSLMFIAFGFAIGYLVGYFVTTVSGARAR